METREWIRLAEAARLEGLPVGIHVSETRLQALLDDYNIAVYLRPHHVVHVLEAPGHVVETLQDIGVNIVYCPVSNAILWGKMPRIYKGSLLGTDNAGWSPLDPWTLASTTLMLLRQTGLDTRQAARETLEAMTIRAWKAFGLNPPLLVLHAPQVVSSFDPYLAILATVSPDQVIGLLSPS